MESTSEVRFAGVQRLYGDDNFRKIKRAHVLIIGVGGVGSWSAESLVRSGVGKITIVDPDSVCESNVNRQLLALNSTLGISKVDVLKKRFLEINPSLIINTVEDFFDDSTADNIFSEKVDYAIDSIDSVKNKILFINKCRELNIPFIISGGAGGKVEPSLIRVADLGESYRDRLLFKIRKELKQRYGYKKGRSKMNIPCVFSPEQTHYPVSGGGVGIRPDSDTGKNISCYSSIGSYTPSTAIFGMMASGHALKIITQ